MRMLITILAALPVGAAAAQPPVTMNPAIPILSQAETPCPTLLTRDGNAPQARVWNLTEAPPGRAYHAVYRRDEHGCIDPVMVGYQYRKR